MSEQEANAVELRRYFDTHKRRNHVENICNGRANWDACDFIDYNMQDFSPNGALCWKQDDRHDCCKVIEITL